MTLLTILFNTIIGLLIVEKLLERVRVWIDTDEPEKVIPPRPDPPPAGLTNRPAVVLHDRYDLASDRILSHYNKFDRTSETKSYAQCLAEQRWNDLVYMREPDFWSINDRLRPRPLQGPQTQSGTKPLRPNQKENYHSKILIGEMTYDT